MRNRKRKQRDARENDGRERQQPMDHVSSRSFAERNIFVV
jgi:hypothetical protein